ncbi:MAG: class I SAM-dependent methyltransferase [Comamonas sp.]|uniref:class I SAM-dependent methyltransferase n=1 Tax=Comamonas sp. TaxID=34028 RepID=UPI002FCC6332
MQPADLSRLKQKLIDAIIVGGPGLRVAIVGWSEAAFELAAMPIFQTGAAALEGFFAPHPGGLVRSLEELHSAAPHVIVIAQDAEKEPLLEAVALLVTPETKLLVGGYAHFEFADDAYERARRNSYITSLANGYPNCLVHIFQCLKNAHRRELKGVVAEFGMFKGGTTMLISKFIEELGASWKVFGFDTFGGFPQRRSPLDMYSHPDCVFTDEGIVRAVFNERNVEIIAGDVVETVSRLEDEKLVLSFVDTDNFTSARAILEVIADRTQVGGAIIFDHWAGTNMFIDTIGERIAAKVLSVDPRYFNLHGTGVFLRQQ